MPCTRPLKGWKLNGKIQWVQPVKAEGITADVVLPCGRCIGCRLMQAKEWSVRISHEAQLHEVNSFVTLTYDPEHLPQFGSLNYPDFQRFMKRLRKALSPKRIRFFMCGEYGDTTRRAHYHAIFFGWAPADGEFFTESRAGNSVYTSKFLAACWGLGHANFSFFEPGAAEYIARYVTKKITGEPALSHYQGLDLTTGEVGPRVPEFARMSRRPGIGGKWFDQYYAADVAARDAVVVDAGRLIKVPRYYDKLTEREFGEEYLAKRKRIRVQKARDQARKDARAVVYGLEATESNQRARLGQMKRDNF